MTCNNVCAGFNQHRLVPLSHWCNDYPPCVCIARMCSLLCSAKRAYCARLVWAMSQASGHSFPCCACITIMCSFLDLSRCTTVQGSHNALWCRTRAKQEADAAADLQQDLARIEELTVEIRSDQSQAVHSESQVQHVYQAHTHSCSTYTLA